MGFLRGKLDSTSNMSKEDLIAELKQARDEAVEAKDEALKATDEIIAAKEEALRVKNELIASLRGAIAEQKSRPLRTSARTNIRRPATNSTSSRTTKPRIRQQESAPPVTNGDDNDDLVDVDNAKSAALPHEALGVDLFMSTTFQYLDMPNASSASLVCSTWAEGVKDVMSCNSYWRTVALGRWPDWAQSVVNGLGKDYDFQSAIKERLIELNDAVIDEWEERGMEDFFARKPEDVPEIAYLHHKGLLESNIQILSVLSKEYDIPPPIFQRYENAVLACYKEAEVRPECRSSPVELPPVPKNLSYTAKRAHEKAIKLVQTIYLDKDGEHLLKEKPHFKYASDEVLYVAQTFESRVAFPYPGLKRGRDGANLGRCRD